MLDCYSTKRKPAGYVILTLMLVFALSNAKAQLVANFTSNVTSGCAPVVVQFQDISTGSPTQWNWTLGNGNTSVLQNPVATYFIPGTYTVKLIVRNASGADSITKTSYIIVNSPPAVAFSVSDSLGCFPLRVQFTDLTTPGSGTITDWQWDFGDGSLATQQNPSHTYTVSGNFTIILKVKNSSGCEKILAKPNHINVQDGVKAGFSFINNSGCSPPAIVNFTNTSTGAGVLSYQWNFGDGNASVATNPTHTYGGNGNYTVQLIASSSLGCRDTITKPSVINIGLVTANFSMPPVICNNTPTLFNNTSNPTAVSAFWDFGDGTTSNQLSPVKTFANTGSFTVKVVSDFGLCKDSISKTITVLGKPTASFTEANNIGKCNPPLTVNFTNTSVGITNVKWFFGDGDSSLLPNPSHTYTTNGFFTVTLVVTNAGGCTDTLRKIDLVKIMPPNITAITPFPYRGCVPYTVSPTAVVTSAEPIAAYSWWFSDGFTSNAVSPTHTFGTQGVYSVRLIVTSVSGCRDTFDLSNAISVYDKPVPNFSATPRDTCAFAEIAFTNLTTGPVTNYEWFFGDGGSSTSENPHYNYSDTGFFSVTLIATNIYCKDSIRIRNYIYIRPPVAGFTKTFSCDTPFLRRFQNISIADSMRIWDFGDGTTDTSKHPVHTYAAPGLYVVKLTVFNGICEHTKRDTLLIIDAGPNFTVSDSIVCKNSNVVFTGLNADTSIISSYQWYFGDNTNAVTFLPTVTHSYGGAGDYNPSLVTTDKLGCRDTVFQNLSIHIYGPKAGFTNPPGTCVFGTINFTDTSLTDGLHPIQQWIWNYGDSGIITQTYSAPPFSHKYDTTGRFNVTLSVIDSYGCKDSIQVPNAVLITKPKADFSVSDTLRCKSNSIIFTNQSSSVIPATYSWDFGDTTSSTQSSPIHSYLSEGLKTVRLAIMDAFGCTDTLIKLQHIRISNPIALFDINDTLAFCPPMLTILNNQSQNFTAISWNFGDGNFSMLPNPSHFYNDPGTYFLTLTATGYGNCKDSTTKRIILNGPSGSFTYSPLNICSPTTVNFVSQTRNNANFIWDFSDGTLLNTTDSVVSHNYTVPGLFRPKMILVDNAGCQVLVTGPDTIRVVGVEADIALSQRTFCDSVTLQLKDTSRVIEDNIVSWLWNFGDGTTSTAQNPTHTFFTTGNYNLSLAVTTSLGCTDTVLFNPGIKIVNSPVIDISSNNNACVNAPFAFAGNILRADTSALQWSWSFGNNVGSLIQNPPVQVYNAAGNYTVRLIATNSSGCADTSSKPIVIHPLPVVDAGLDTVVCRGISYLLQPSGAASYTWQAHPTLSCTNCTSPLAVPDTLTRYFVTGTNAFGCSASDSVSINVIQKFKVTVSQRDTLCIGESAQLQAFGANSYLWSPSTGLNNALIPNPLASPTITTNYMLVGTDVKKCFNDTAYVPISVYPIPQFNIVESLVTTNVGNSVPITTINSSDITKWRWTPNRWLDNPTSSQPVASPKDNITYKCEVSNDGGCKANDEIRIELLCNGSNVFIPNTFSPNGDGANDVFYIRGKGLFGVKVMKIFNRWGELVFEKTNFTPNDAALGWDGMFKGNKLTPDVYVYFVEVTCDNSIILKYQGNVTLLR